MSRWLDEVSAAPSVDDAPDQEQQRQQWHGPVARQLGVEPPRAVFATTTAVLPVDASHWWLGAHGGAGESILTALDPAGAAAEHRLPTTGAPVLVCCRLTMPGLEAARALAQAVAAGSVRANVLGLVTVAGSPRVPKGALKDFHRIVCGAFPASWAVPWVEDFGLTLDPQEVAVPKSVRTVLHEVRALSENNAKGRH